ncbi:MAG: hypothetical protein IJZ94_05375 [Clostridia bacterium]|nr:hypothetical protein [Clostridia bacterium]
MKKIRVVCLLFITVILCSCSSNQHFVYEEMYNYMWVPDRASDYYYKIENFTDGVYVWGFDLKEDEVSELEASEKFNVLSKEDVKNIEFNVFHEGIPEWWGLSPNSVFYMYAPYKNEESTDTSLLGSTYYIYIWDIDANEYFCIYKY